MVDAVVDFRAQIDSSRSDRDGFERARVLASDSQVVFVTDETKRRIALSDVFDLSQGVSKATGSSDEESLTIAFRDGEMREAVTVRCDAGTLSNFQVALFKLLLDGTTVRFRSDGGTRTGEFSNGSLQVTRDAVTLDIDGGGLQVDLDDVARFETDSRTVSDEPSPVVSLFWADESYDAKTTVFVPTFRHLNLFGRFMQSYTVPSTVTPADGWIRVLLVDDDPHDLEMAELLLSEQEPDFSIETADSAAGGHRVLADDDPVHCVVSDYDMPDTDGIEFLRQVRENHPDLPFVLFTGQGSEDVAKQALLSDVTDYVEKDIGSKQYDILADRVTRAVR